MAIITLYAAGIQQAVATGNLEEMRRVAQEAERHLAEYGNVPVALEVLKTEIAKLERQSGRS